MMLGAHEGGLRLEGVYIAQPRGNITPKHQSDKSDAFIFHRDGRFSAIHVSQRQAESLSMSDGSALEQGDSSATPPEDGGMYCINNGQLNLCYTDGHTVHMSFSTPLLSAIIAQYRVVVLNGVRYRLSE